MSERKIKDLSASVHRRLLNKAREENRPFNELLQYYAMERFLYRLSKSQYSEKFILKGALMLVAWNAPALRPTSDIDLLGLIENDIETIVAVMREICAQEVEPDGITFDANRVSGEMISEAADNQGVRVIVRSNLGNAQIKVQLDVGFGDSIMPSAITLTYPVLLEMPAPTLRGYSRESMIAEKLQAIAQLGMLNSRMKDFFDIWLLSRQYGFDGKTLRSAIGKTFTNRGTEVSPELIALIHNFSRDETKLSQWQAFCRKNRLESSPNLEQVAQSITEFIRPLLSGKSFEGAWTPPGPWVPA